MQDLAYFYPEGHARHFERGHPERPERVETIRQALVEMGWWDAARYPQLDPLEPPIEVLSAIHTMDYLRILEAVCAQGRHFDMDTYTTTASWQLALNAAGGAMSVAEVIWRQEARRGFAICRPPGHHATPNRAMGFCLLNNVALAAEHLQQKFGARKLAIVDLDLHHGNGTQDIFWQRGDVFYISTHQSPLYPGTGGLREIGSGAGEGAYANFPMAPMTGDVGFRAVLDEALLPLLERFSPEMLLVSYGFDTHWRDPLGNLLLSAAGYASLVTALAQWADRNCGGKIMLVLEGGYDLEAAAACAQGVVAALLGETWEDTLGPAPYVEGEAWRSMLNQAKRIWTL